jgi:hypothetical protein
MKFIQRLTTFFSFLILSLLVSLFGKQVKSIELSAHNEKDQQLLLSLLGVDHANADVYVAPPSDSSIFTDGSSVDAGSDAGGF